jgi:hypothetical protein
MEDSFRMFCHPFSNISSDEEEWANKMSSQLASCIELVELDITLVVAICILEYAHDYFLFEIELGIMYLRVYRDR